MSQFSHILLDLDGTVTNPQEGITKSVAYALDYFSIPHKGLSSLCTFIGPPLDQSFMEYGIKKEDIPLAIKKFREYYADKGIYECYLFEGMQGLLQNLKHHDKKIYLATSKVRDYAKQILKHYDIIEYFDFVSGSEFDGTRTLKADVIAFALSQTNTMPSSSVAMVGDRKHDIIGAKTHKLFAVSVLYGFGSKEEFQEHGTDHIAETVEDLGQFLLR